MKLITLFHLPQLTFILGIFIFSLNKVALKYIFTNIVSPGRIVISFFHLLLSADEKSLSIISKKFRSFILSNYNLNFSFPEKQLFSIPIPTKNNSFNFTQTSVVFV